MRRPHDARRLPDHLRGQIAVRRRRLAVFVLDSQNLQYGTYLRSTGSDTARYVTRDRVTDLLWIAGYTNGGTFPTTGTPLQSCGNGGDDAFLVAIAPAGRGSSELRYGTCLGSSGDDLRIALALDSKVLGLAASVSQPVGSGRTPDGRAFFDETYKGASGTVNDYLALLGLGGSAAAPIATVRACSDLGSDRDTYTSGGLALWLQPICERDTCVAS